MRLREVAEAFDELGATAARGRRVEIVADLLRRSGPDDVAPLVYLLQGELRPPYEGVALGVGEKTLVQVLADAYDAAHSSVAGRLSRLGDAGLVAEQLAPPSVRRRVSLREAYDVLLATARVSGSGAQAGKRARLAALLARVDRREAKLLARVAQGKLRVGVGEQIVLEAAALAALGDRGAKPLVERAFNVRSDLGAVVRLAFARGRRALAALQPTPGVPVRPALAQRLPSARAIVERLGEVQAEPKYDGFRLQLHRDGERVWAFSRRLEDVSAMFPEVTAALPRQLGVRSAIVEGEAVVHDPATGEFLPFQVTITRKRKTGVAEAAARLPLTVFTFDLLAAGGRSWLARPQRERSARLRELIRSAPGEPLAVTEARVVRRPEELEAYFHEMVARGLEGVVAKRLDAPYRAGARGYDWVKLKRVSGSALRDTVDVVVVGYLRGRGKRAALGIGSLLGAVYDPEGDRFRTVAKVGSGLSERGWRELRALLDVHAVAEKPDRVDSIITPDVWVAPACVVEVRADEITRSPRHTCGRVGAAPGYALRFPRLVGDVRADKGPEEATTEREILDLYRQQRRGRLGGGAGAPESSVARQKHARARRKLSREDARGRRGPSPAASPAVPE